MQNSSDNRMPHSAGANTIQPTNASVTEIPGKSTRNSPSNAQSQYSMIGKSIVVKGEITASDPLYIYGRVEGLINAEAHRVTIGKEGKVKADISAREVVIMGEVCGNLDGGYRVEIRSDGSLTGDLTAQRICIEDGAFLQGTIDVLRSGKEERTEGQEEQSAALEQEVATHTAEPDVDRQTWASVAASEPG
jgi:cytoskeletal protein CcmA (bactofilin family)